jgi:hypothetical protein
MLLLQFVSINTLSPYAVWHHYIPIANISPQYDCYSLASLVEAFIGVAVNKEDSRRMRERKRGTRWLN